MPVHYHVVAKSSSHRVRSKKKETKGSREREIALHCYPRGFDTTIGLAVAEQKERERPVFC